MTKTNRNNEHHRQQQVDSQCQQCIDQRMQAPLQETSQTNPQNNRSAQEQQEEAGHFQQHPCQFPNVKCKSNEANVLANIAINLFLHSQASVDEESRNLAMMPNK